MRTYYARSGIMVGSSKSEEFLFLGPDNNCIMQNIIYSVGPRKETNSWCSIYSCRSPNNVDTSMIIVLRWNLLRYSYYIIVQLCLVKVTHNMRPV